MYIKRYDNFITENFRNHTRGNKLYHYTLKDNLDDILKEGLIPNKNSSYSNGTNAVFLTNKDSLYSANLPQGLMDEMSYFYDNNEEYKNEDRPIVRLTISLDNLDQSKFYPDDDYLSNKYNWNKAKSLEDQLEESLKVWGSICYTDIISPNSIVNIDYDYHN